MLSTYGESFAMASASGIQPSQLLEVLQLGVCNSPLLSLKGAKMLAGDHATNFPLKHAQKDMRLAVDLGTNCGLALPIAVSTDVQMKAAMEPPLELRDSDFSAMFEAQKVAGEMALERLRFHLKYNTRRIEDAK
jgi:glyoxylate/succinic semialdehyde reductase